MRIHNMAVVLTTAAAAGGLLAGCGSNTNTTPVTPLPATSSAPAATGQQQHNQADVVFLQNMIPHHNQAIMMSQMARNRATSPKVKDLAARIEAEQGPEIQQMRALLTAWGIPAPATPGAMGGMGDMGQGQMPGMMSGGEMHQLGQATGAAFDRMFLQMMIVHHQGAINMSQTELAQGSNPDARDLAQRIIKTQQAEINEMQTLLQQI
jgi:uncharacterized protein (DUF305 family)